MCTKGGGRRQVGPSVNASVPYVRLVPPAKTCVALASALAFAFAGACAFAGAFALVGALAGALAFSAALAFAAATAADASAAALARHPLLSRGQSAAVGVAKDRLGVFEARDVLPAAHRGERCGAHRRILRLGFVALDVDASKVGL